ncbi:MAG: AmmeMemoRadiSam system radical SAM enzyme [Bacteroidales bacterium]|nr:AmmeMemoRadiSam system radical SAM enzyme [Bacteroidales bacterium]
MVFINFDKGYVKIRMNAEKYHRESPYYLVTPKGVRCQICPNNCLLNEEMESCCHTHFVKDQKLYTLGYGNPCAVHVDPIEKKPLFHFLPGSFSFSISVAGCNMACLNCQNWEISQQGPLLTRNVELFPDQVVEEAVKNNCSSIAFTYSEPIAFYEYVRDTARLSKARGIKNLFISNGYINEKPLEDLAGYLDAANIDLKSFSEETYRKLNRGSLQPVLNTLKLLKRCGVWVEITNLLIPGWNDDMQKIREMCNWLASNGFSETPLHFSRFFPLHKLTGFSITSVKTLEEAHDIAVEAGLQYVYVGNLQGNDSENTYCPSCKRLLVKRQGFQIRENHIRGSNCKYCNTRISGVWDHLSK